MYASSQTFGHTWINLFLKILKTLWPESLCEKFFFVGMSKLGQHTNLFTNLSFSFKNCMSWNRSEWKSRVQCAPSVQNTWKLLKCLLNSIPGCTSLHLKAGIYTKEEAEIDHLCYFLLLCKVENSKNEEQVRVCKCFLLVVHSRCVCVWTASGKAVTRYRTPVARASGDVMARRDWCYWEKQKKSQETGYNLWI